jgi:ribosomal RNA assembly protein
MKYIKIPMERIGVLIGHNGENKEKLEKLTKILINIDSKFGEISLDGRHSNDPLEILKIENIILAIGRGFSPENAFLLLNDEFEFFVFDIRDYVGNKENHIKRLKSRIIGRHGKTKRIMQELTDSYISIYGHTISIISNFENIHILKKAIDMLLSGSMHATVYKYIEMNMKKLRLQRSY